MHLRLSRPGDLEQIKAIYATVHPYPVERTDDEWRSYDVLVATDGSWAVDPDSWTDITGYTALSFTHPPFATGVETLVRPDRQALGVGRALMAWRLTRLDGRPFIGAVEGGNARMEHLLQSFGLHRLAGSVVFPTGARGHVYVS